MSIVNIFGNNVRILDNARFVGFLRGDSLQIRFPLAWDNSWRDKENWDAVYLFMKYRDPSKDGGIWHHAYLEEGGHNVGTALEYIPMKSDEKTVGIMVLRNENTNVGFGDISANIRLLWNFKNGTAPYTLRQEDFGDGRIEFAVFAIEMVYVANGPYYVGDNYSYNSIKNEIADDKKLISSEAMTKLSFEGKNTDVVTLPDAYPKGYNGFYCMKYEVSQEQYVSFLNFLTYSQQKKRIGNDLDKLKPGQFVFGSVDRPTCRNSIIVTEQNGASRPAVFGNNLNMSNPYNRKDDGKSIACNFLTYSDVLAYCQWAGLRPMSELEYEKACRALFIYYTPQIGDLAWGNQNMTPLINIKNEGELTEESMDGANMNAGKFYGPVRCGAFAFYNNTNQQDAGASYWGVMEMTGNLKEICCNVRDGQAMLPHCGNGNINDVTVGWITNPLAYIARGGDFLTLRPEELATSYRREDQLILKSDKRDSTLGFRAVHSVKPVDLVGEFIFLPNAEDRDVMIGCNASPYTITGNQTMANDFYVWEKCDSTAMGMGKWRVIEKENAFDITLTNLENTTYVDTIWKFRRRTVKPKGDSYSNEVTLIVPGIPILSNTVVNIYGCGGVTDPLIATSGYKGTFTWKILYASTTEVIRTINNVSCDTLIVEMGLLNIPPGETSSFFTLVCEFSIAGSCSVASEATIYLDGLVTCPVECVDSRDGQKYKVVQMPDCRCWFAEPLRYKTPGSVSADNNIANDSKYGRLYAWNVDLIDLKLCPLGWKVPGTWDIQDLTIAVNDRSAALYVSKWVENFADHGWYYDKSTFGRGFYSASNEQNAYLQIFSDKLFYVDGYQIGSEFSPNVYLPVRCVME